MNREIVFYKDGYTLTDAGFEDFLKTGAGRFVVIKYPDCPSVFIEHLGIVHMLSSDQERSFSYLLDKLEENNDFKIIKYTFDKKISFLEEFSFTISKPQERGTVYVYECNGYYKIGYTGNVQKRRARYVTENPHEIKTIHEYEVWNAYKCEKLLHEYFSKKRHRGEWFYLDRKDLKFIGYLLTNDPVFIVDDYSCYFHSRFNGTEPILERLSKNKMWKSIKSNTNF